MQRSRAPATRQLIVSRWTRAGGPFGRRGPRRMGRRARWMRTGLDRASVLSLGSVASVLSILSLRSAGSILSMGSIGSVLSIGSAGSLLSIGSAGSILCIGSTGSVLSIGGRRAVLNRAQQPGQASEAPTDEAAARMSSVAGA